LAPTPKKVTHRSVSASGRLKKLEEAEVSASADEVLDSEVCDPVMVEIDIVAVMWWDDAVGWGVDDFPFGSLRQRQQTHSRCARCKCVHIESLTG
jgi:hypothetical protein